MFFEFLIFENIFVDVLKILKFLFVEVLKFFLWYAEHGKPEEKSNIIYSLKKKALKKNIYNFYIFYIYIYI